MDASRSTVFICYSRKDRKWLDRVRVHLGPLEHAGRVDAWDDTRIEPGMRWQEEIGKAVRSARVAVLLVSADFMASRYIRDRELPTLLAAAEKEGVLILPLILSASGFGRDPLLSSFAAVNDLDRPLKDLPTAQREKILDRLSARIEQALEDSAREGSAGEEAREPAEAREWTARLNAAFAGAAAVHRVVRQEPEIVVVGPAELSADEQRMAEKFRPALDAARMNDPHALVSIPPVWSENPVTLAVQALDYASVRALRESGKKPALVSGGAVIFCEATRELLLHRRARTSASYPGSINTVGGGYMPPGLGPLDDRASLITTAKREVREELHVSLAWNETPPMLLSEESTTGFVQFVLLGVNLNAHERARAIENPEGKLVAVPFDDLLEWLNRAESKDPRVFNTGWVPSGKVHVLAWLALGAPGAKSPLRFGRHSAVELFEAAMEGRDS